LVTLSPIRRLNAQAVEEHFLEKWAYEKVPCHAWYGSKMNKDQPVTPAEHGFRKCWKCSREVVLGLTSMELTALRDELDTMLRPRQTSPPALYCLTISTRRFCVLPASVSLDATGAYGPAPNESSRPAQRDT
jgi:hypothetical protein